MIRFLIKLALFPVTLILTLLVAFARFFCLFSVLILCRILQCHTLTLRAVSSCHIHRHKYRGHRHRKRQEHTF